MDLFLLFLSPEAPRENLDISPGVSKHPVVQMQIPRAWIVIVGLIGTASLGISLDFLYDTNAASKISSETAESKKPFSHPSGINTGEKLLTAGKLVNL